MNPIPTKTTIKEVQDFKEIKDSFPELPEFPQNPQTIVDNFRITVFPFLPFFVKLPNSKRFQTKKIVIFGKP